MKTIIYILAVCSIISSCKPKGSKQPEASKHSIDASKKDQLCKCPREYRVEDSSKLEHIKDIFYRNETGHLYESTVGQKNFDGKLADYIYFNGVIAQEIDPESFAPITGFYAKDKEHIYYYRPTMGGMQISLIAEANSKTFEVLKGHYMYAKDDAHYFDNASIIKGFTPADAQLVLDDEGRATQLTSGNKTFKLVMPE